MVPALKSHKNKFGRTIYEYYIDDETTCEHLHETGHIGDHRPNYYDEDEEHYGKVWTDLKVDNHTYVAVPNSFTTDIHFYNHDNHLSSKEVKILRIPEESHRIMIDVDEQIYEDLRRIYKKRVKWSTACIIGITLLWSIREVSRWTNELR